MNNHFLKTILCVVAVTISTFAVRADYSSGVLALKPAAYWPLQGTNFSLVHLATNSGTLGAQGNAHYNNAFYVVNSTNFMVKSLFPGPGAGVTSDGDAGAKFNGGTNGNDNSQYLIIPDVNQNLEQGSGAFTAEAWVYPQGGDPNDPTGSSFASTEWTTIIGKGGGGAFGLSPSGDAGGNTYGWSIEMAGIYTLGYPVGWYTPGPVFLQTNACWIVDMYNGANGNNPSLEFMVPFKEPTPQWFHLVLSYDGTTVNFYTNGVLAATTTLGLPQSTNYVYGANQAPITSVNGDYELTGYAPDKINPMVIGNIDKNTSFSSDGYPNAIGGTIGFNCQNFNGVMDEVAVYPSALSGAAIAQHYTDATSSNHSLYTNDVLSASPSIYLRFDEPTFAADPVAGFTGFTIATNLGAASGIDGHIVNALSVVGPQLPGFGAATNALFLNGMDAAVDVGNGGNLYKTALDPTNYQAFSVMYWFKANPADVYARFQGILGRGDAGWRSSLDGSGFIRWNPGNGPEIASPQNYNDDAWHNVVGVSDGNSAYLYVDGQLSTSSGGVGQLSAQKLDLLIGGAPDYSAGSGNRFFDGQMTQVAFFTNALTAIQVMTLYDDAVSSQPIITQNPQTTSINLGGATSFTVLASGQPLTYQWYLGSTKLSDVVGNISGSTTATLTITNALNSNAGNYSVVVSNSYGAVTSAVANLTVYSSVVLSSDITPTNSILFAGGSQIFSIKALGALPIGYQWYSNNIAILGATNTTYTLTNAQTAASFYCVASNSFNSQPSSTATLTVISPTANYPATIVAAHPVGFWRLNEPDAGGGNNGLTAHDYWGGYDGVYNQVTLGQSGYNPSEPLETSAQFGYLSFSNCMVFNVPTNVNFSAPSGGNSSFSVECWVNGYQQAVDAGIVSIGVSGSEQFDLDTGANDPNQDFRFFFRDASGGVHGVNSSIQSDGQWHHLVGVVDEVNNNVALYIDGVLIGSATISPNIGVLATSQGMKIGARPSSTDPNLNANQFAGNIDDVSVYHYALTASQVVAHYDSAEIPAKVVIQPTNCVASVGGNATFYAGVEGTPPLTNQWYNATTGQPISGATNETLVLTNVQASNNGNSYYLSTANMYGQSQSQYATLTVISGAPQIYTDVQTPFFAIEGGTGSDSVTAYGSAPLTYQWQLNGINVTGATSNVLTVADAQPSEAGSYRVIVSNSFGSVTSSVALFIVGSTPVGFNVNGGGWQSNGNAKIAANLLTLTDGGSGETSSFFYQYPQYIGAFKASYTYQDVGGSPNATAADGVAFCIQNDPRGTAAIGGGGGSLGVSGIAPSAELEFNIYAGENIGYTFLTGGLTGAGGANGNYVKVPTVPINSGNPISVTVNYDGANISLTLMDKVTAASFSTNFVVGDLTQAVGGESAYVGFTGASGGYTATQTITNFSFISIPLETIQRTSSNTVTVSWPDVISGYILQQNSSLTTTNWVNVTNADNILNGVHQVVLPFGSTNEFYRLKLP